MIINIFDCPSCGNKQEVNPESIMGGLNCNNCDSRILYVRFGDKLLTRVT